MPRSKLLIEKVMEQIAGFLCWTYLLDWTAWHTENCSLHMLIQRAVHNGSTRMFFMNENQDGKGKKPQVKIILPSFPLFSRWIIRSEEETRLVWGSQFLSRPCWCFLSPHSLSILINCFVNNHGAMDIMLMSDPLKEHMTVCFPLLSFDEGVWVLWG